MPAVAAVVGKLPVATALVGQALRQQLAAAPTQEALNPKFTRAAWPHTHPPFDGQLCPESPATPEDTPGGWSRPRMLLYIGGLNTTKGFMAQIAILGIPRI